MQDQHERIEVDNVVETETPYITEEMSGEDIFVPPKVSLIKALLILYYSRTVPRHENA